MTAVLPAHQPADITRAAPAHGNARGVARRDKTAFPKAHQAADVSGYIAVAGVLGQVVDQAEAADVRVAINRAEEADIGLIAADGEVADVVAVAVEVGDKGVISVAYRQPATGATCHRKIIGPAVTRIQEVPLTGIKPSAAIAIAIKVQILHELIAPAAPPEGTARAVPSCVGAGLVARARQVVAHVVQIHQVIDLDQAIAIVVGINYHLKADPVSVLKAIAVCGCQLEHQRDFGRRHHEGRYAGVGIAEFDPRACQLPPTPGFDDDAAKPKRGDQDDGFVGLCR